MDDNNKEYKTLWPEVLKWAKQQEVTGFGFSKTFIVVPNGFQQVVQVAPKDKHHINFTDTFGKTDMIDQAHEAGMEVHVFTFRNENKFLLFEYGQDPYQEFEKFYNLGIDGFFTDFPATAKRFFNSVFHETNNASINFLNYMLLLFCAYLHIFLKT